MGGRGGRPRQRRTPSTHDPALHAQLIEHAFHGLAKEHPGAVFVSPSAAFMASAGVADAVAGPLGLAGARLVLLPVNDNEEVTLAEGGTHWCGWRGG